MLCRVAACLSILIALAIPVRAQAPQAVQPAQAVEPASPAGAGLLIQRAGGPSEMFSPERLAALPAFTQRAALGPRTGDRENEWTGPLLWDVLITAGAVDASRPRNQVNVAVRITGADGYAVLIALGEISPNFAGRKIQLADLLNGQPLPDHGLRLIVPGDLLGGRSVRDVVRIVVE